jgi:membrane associated rhomboid family serine protease
MLNTASAIRWLLGANILIYAVFAVLPASIVFELVDKFAFISVRYVISGLWRSEPAAYFLAPFTHMFLHASLPHLLINMAMLLAFGTAIARRMRTGPFLAFHAICGVAGALFWALMNPYSIDPLLGASGAISGMVGAVAGIALSEPPGHGMPFRDSGAALAFVAVWLALNFIVGLFGAAAMGIDGAIAWEAHLGGFVAGFAVIRLFPRSGGANRV